MSTLVVAIDAGATWSRGMLVDIDVPDHGTGRLQAAGRGGAGNANQIGEPAAVANVSSLLLGLLASAHASGTEVAALTIASSLRETATTAARLCPNAAVVAVPDTVAAFYSGAAGDTGVVATAGTGSMVSRLVDGQAVASAGGWGWALGDDGGAVAIGRQCLRAVLHALDGGPPTELTRAVTELLGAGDADTLYAAVYRRGLVPLQLARFAPVVTAAARTGDLVAHDILVDNAAQLAAQVAGLVQDGDELVLAGGVMAEIAEYMVDLVPVSVTAVVPDGVVGGIRLAARALGVELDRDALGAHWAPHCVRPDDSPTR